MKVLGRDKLTEFSQKHANAKKALEAWFSEANEADWKTPQDIKNRYRSADFLADNRVIFNVKGNHYRLVVKVRYQNGIAVIEWVGTHSEYDKQRF
ncbi:MULTISPECIES: type II toxin-antitoxin system HigB family toxin [Pseudoalteromonas]|jgi:mRNA interferase HigB|uniref:Type II toxin-antitoxin system HigB family toxin n=1 Tax=Pseudoalteromonas prydzensis TaxID=182141 RepID=A0ABR9FMR9_9GAMM|nr:MULTISPECIES: type II toxin-antitoxin system HigB family toxin [Pseudoalteromonas]MBL1383401.1 type II toxin-antitoxin system HigB family toxin [Colwellia sp.]MBE0458099.1 type II toxin-antitoxin system HigB family toxin [Pseudoalteromonas prydzensis]NWL14843.1 type II toxin-antitoxin system HigB family toxin [Pseudoalteromonas sp. Scap03]QLE82839.1 type II toxin-antitoxin system HigB family toxin [Pseudoalteromonas sp. Scap25]QLE90782.1 type II toxin-antitoxin system HigB family toxin [Pse|tara:strand:- start:46 stop:330 length:285 start_codon:yes stop_codon:yes gene_type:complete